MVELLDIAIQKFWIDKYSDDKFKKYSVFHKSEGGESINLDTSEHSTRIVSIHTSKGDGRSVVFVIGLDEKSLLKFSGTNDNMIYK